MKIGIGAVIIAAVIGAGLWMAGIIGGEKVYGSQFLNGRSHGEVGTQVYMIIGEGGVPEGLATGTEITIGSIDSGEAYCRAKIFSQVENPGDSGYGVECIESR